MTESTQDFGYLALFDPFGNQVEAAMEDLLSIEAQSFDRDVHLRAVNYQSGRYWLISDRPGYYAMVLEVSIFLCYPRTPDHVKWDISYGTSGIADDALFDIERAIRAFSDSKGFPEPADSAPIPENVAVIARERVRYRLGRSTEQPSGYTIQLCDAVDMRERLDNYLVGTVDPSELIRTLAGRTVGAYELLLAVTMFAGDHNLDEHIGHLVPLLVPDEHHARLEMLVAAAEQQFGQE